MEDAKVLVIGSGGREHAMTWSLSRSENIGQIWVAPGNPGTAEIAANVDIAADDLDGLVAFVKEKDIDLVAVGPEVPLALGISNRMQAAGVRVFGPSQEAAQIEASKAFSKAFMQEHGIPTADYAEFDDIDAAREYVRTRGGAMVVKADGLAAGKGVILCDSTEEALAALETVMVEDAFGAAGSRVIIEELLAGKEVSVLAFSDGKTIVTMPPSRDHKRAYDNDEGPNTGGMGAFSPPPDVDAGLVAQIAQTVLRPAVDGMAARGTPYVGVLYAGMILTPDGPKTLEFNCRFGDPETQVVLPLLETDLLDVMLACVDGTLDEIEVRWNRGACATVVMASEGYPGSYPKGLPITGVKQTNNLRDVEVFQAGTAQDVNGQLVTAGGRVLAVTATGASLSDALRKAYAGVAQIRFEGAHYRRDIGRGL